MKDYVVAILILYAIVSIILAICIFTDKKVPVQANHSQMATPWTETSV